MSPEKEERYKKTIAELELMFNHLRRSGKHCWGKTQVRQKLYTQEEIELLDTIADLRLQLLEETTHIVPGVLREVIKERNQFEQQLLQANELIHSLLTKKPLSSI